MFHYESISVHYRDGKLTSGYLTITQLNGDKGGNIDLRVTLTKPDEIMANLRRIERKAGHAAELEEGTVYGLFGKPMKTFNKWVSVAQFIK